MPDNKGRNFGSGLPTGLWQRMYALTDEAGRKGDLEHRLRLSRELALEERAAAGKPIKGKRRKKAKPIEANLKQLTAAVENAQSTREQNAAFDELIAKVTGLVEFWKEKG